MCSYVPLILLHAQENSAHSSEVRHELTGLRDGDDLRLSGRDLWIYLFLLHNKYLNKYHIRSILHRGL
jgi:hypothetical protein